ncbi:MAG: response regulator transcription factor [Oscillospiraceae bacterium]
MEKQTILVVEDDRSMGIYLSSILSKNNYDVHYTRSGKKALSLIPTLLPRLVVMGTELHDIVEMELLCQIKKHLDIPVVILSGRAREEDKVKALDAGADDFITKPFGTNEMLARLRVAMRHYLHTRVSDTSIYAYKDMKIDFCRRNIRLSENEIHLTQNEFRIVSLLAKNGGTVLTHDFIINKIWGFAGSDDNKILRVNMTNIRRKIENNPTNPEYIFTEIGVGYRMHESVV